MKKSKLILLFICIANFGAANAEEKMLSKVQIFQAIDKAEPRLFSIIKAAHKGIVEYSQESADFKACGQKTISLIEEAQKIKTEAQAQLFAIHFEEAMTACKTIGSTDMEKTINKYTNNQLPLIQIAQQVIKAFPVESINILVTAAIEMENGNESDPFQGKSSEIIATMMQLSNIKTEKQAQDFTQKLKAVLYDTPKGKIFFDAINDTDEETLKNK